MDYRTIAVVVTDLAADAPVIESAVTLASDLEAHLDIHCIGIDTSRYEPLPAASAAILVEAGLAEAQARAADLKEWVLTKVPRDMA